mmetsp:Transcript_70898/g.156411  ORF Transcript_70898/g.156411 Transcript_70898/m.156411 type:complete len:210 (+) Transcript_70898:735-1364(+)
MVPRGEAAIGQQVFLPGNDGICCHSIRIGRSDGVVPNLFGSLCGDARIHVGAGAVFILCVERHRWHCVGLQSGRLRGAEDWKRCLLSGPGCLHGASHSFGSSCCELEGTSAFDRRLAYGRDLFLFVSGTYHCPFNVSDPGAHASPGLLTPDFAVPRPGGRHQPPHHWQDLYSSESANRVAADLGCCACGWCHLGRRLCLSRCARHSDQA